MAATVIVFESISQHENQVKAVYPLNRDFLRWLRILKKNQNKEARMTKPGCKILKLTNHMSCSLYY